MTPARTDPYIALRNADFRWFSAAMVTFTFATQIQATVVAWQVYEITHDALSLGFVGLSEALPFIGAALYAGHLADIHNRKRMSLVSFAVQVICAAGLLFLTIDRALIVQSVLPIYGVVFVSGLARSFLQPARNALAAEIVPREIYANATAWRTSLWQAGAVVGPALGGLVYGFSGARSAYELEMVLCILSLLLFAQITYTAHQRAAHQGTIGENLTMGMRFLLTQPELLGAQLLDLFSVLFGGAPALFPIFTRDILHVGPEGLGILRAAPAVGALIMSVALAHRQMRNAGRVLLAAVAVFGLSWIGFALSRSFAVSIVLLMISGMADTISVVVRSTLMTLRTPRELLGRVSAVNQIFIGSSNEIGAFESGVAARLLGAVNAVVFGGLVTLGVVGFTGWRIPKLRKLDTLD